MSEMRTCTVCDNSDGRHHGTQKSLTSVWPQLDTIAWREVDDAHAEFLERLHAIVERSCYRDALRRGAALKARAQARKEGKGE